MQIDLRMETLVDEVATARVALSCHFALDPLCDKSGSCRFPQKRLPRKLSRSDTFVAAHLVSAQTFLVDETPWHTPFTALVGRKSHSDYRSVS